MKIANSSVTMAGLRRYEASGSNGRVRSQAKSTSFSAGTRRLLEKEGDSIQLSYGEESSD